MIKDPTLAEVLELMGEDDTDIADTVFDFYGHISYVLGKKAEDIDDSYSKCMNLFCELIIVERVVPANSNHVGFVTCKITDFVEKYKKSFRKEMNESYEEGYRPCDWEEDYDSSSEEFYDTYLTEFMTLINGDCCSEDYQLLYESIKEEMKGE